MTEHPPCIWVLAGTNGSGKSSIGGAMLRDSGGDYFNPDEIACELLIRKPGLTQTEANAKAWQLGLRQLDAALHNGYDYFFESTLGGTTIVQRLNRALGLGYQVRVWYVGLTDPELHIARVAARVRRGGHDIPEATIRHRFDTSRRHLIRLLPALTELKIYDNSAERDPQRGQPPRPILLLHWQAGRLVAPRNLRKTPAWAQPIVAQALKSTRSELR